MIQRKCTTKGGVQNLIFLLFSLCCMILTRKLYLPATKENTVCKEIAMKKPRCESRLSFIRYSEVFRTRRQHLLSNLPNLLSSSGKKLTDVLLHNQDSPILQPFFLRLCICSRVPSIPVRSSSKRGVDATSAANIF